jgi:hypothetical protein
MNLGGLAGGIGGMGGGMGMLGSLFGGGGGSGLNSLLQQMKRQQALRYTQAFANQYQGLDQLKKGYDEAITNVGRTGLASKMGIEAQGQQTAGKIAQSYTNRGLSNTTAMGSTQALAGGQTAQALAGVDQAVAQAKAGLLTSKGNALSSAYGNLSQLNQNQLQSEMGLGQMAWQNLASQPSDYEQMLALFQSVGGFLPLAMA